jgi:hypothetical protein
VAGEEIAKRGPVSDQPAADVRGHRESRILEGGRGQRIAHADHRGLHEGRVKGAGDVEPDRPRPSAACRVLSALDRLERSGQNDLLRRVLVRDREDVAAPGDLADLCSVRRGQAEQRGHRAGPLQRRRLHGAPPLGYELDGVAEGQGARSHERRELAQRMSRRRLGPDATGLEHAPGRYVAGEQRRLSELRGREEFLVAAPGRHVPAERGGRLVEHAGARRVRHPWIGHAGELRTLSGKQQSQCHGHSLSRSRRARACVHVIRPHSSEGGYPRPGRATHLCR